MPDTNPPESPAGMPFTRAEYVRAQLQVRPRAEADALAARLFDTRELIGVHLMDGDLLLLALVSDDLAARVIAWRPSLRERVEAFRADPQTVLASWRSAASGDAPP